MAPKNNRDPVSSLELTLRIPLTYARSGRNLAWAAMAGARELRPLEHHPAHDVVDAHTGCRFYYHGHDLPGAPSAWHGHFHLFVPHPKGTGFSHLAALALSDQGMPQQWFSTNQWVTGESWASARQLKTALSSYAVATSGRLSPVAQWVSAFVSLEQDTLIELLRARDARLAELSSQRSQARVLADRRVHVLSMRAVRWLEKFAPPSSSLTH